MRGKNVNPGSLLLGDGGRDSHVPPQEKVRIILAQDLPESRKWLPEGTGDLGGQEHPQIAVFGFVGDAEPNIFSQTSNVLGSHHALTHSNVNRIGRADLLPKIILKTT